MKQSRRHELKTNELSVFLQQIYASLTANLHYVIGGVVVVAIILGIALHIQHRRERNRQQVWTQLDAIESGSIEKDPALLEKARQLAKDQQGSAEFGPRTTELAADLAYDLAMSLDPIAKKKERLDLFHAARDGYQNLLQQAPDQPAAIARAHMGLAKVEESLLVAGEGSKDKVRAEYEALIKAPAGLYGGLAARELSTLDERIQPLNVVATRPASATAPATSTATAPAN